MYGFHTRQEGCLLVLKFEGVPKVSSASGSGQPENLSRFLAALSCRFNVPTSETTTHTIFELCQESVSKLQPQERGASLKIWKETIQAWGSSSLKDSSVTGWENIIHIAGSMDLPFLPRTTSDPHPVLHARAVWYPPFHGRARIKEVHSADITWHK